jgi:outer membrane murein-binding lipoprotein Lpp
MENDVLLKWNELKSLVETLEVDVAKNARGVSAAGVRARKAINELKKLASKYRSTQLAESKAVK